MNQNNNNLENENYSNKVTNTDAPNLESKETE